MQPHPLLKKSVTKPKRGGQGPPRAVEPTMIMMKKHTLFMGIHEISPVFSTFFGQ
jgi:hypothetical protein